MRRIVRNITEIAKPQDVSCGFNNLRLVNYNPETIAHVLSALEEFIVIFLKTCFSGKRIEILGVFVEDAPDVVVVGFFVVLYNIENIVELSCVAVFGPETYGFRLQKP